MNPFAIWTAKADSYQASLCWLINFGLGLGGAGCAVSERERPGDGSNAPFDDVVAIPTETDEVVAEACCGRLRPGGNLRR